MSVKYAEFTVGVHNLDIDTIGGLEKLRIAIKEAIEHAHPKGYFGIQDQDVTVDIEEIAGSYGETE